MIRKSVNLFLLYLMSSTFAFASPFGVSGLIPINSDLNGYRFAFTYQPPCLTMKHTSIYFDASYGRWWLKESSLYRDITIYSVAPYFRLYINKNNFFSPFIELSLGLAYLAKTHLDQGNLGIHFAFQDQIGIGATYGIGQRLFSTFSFLHYSNGRFCINNSGMTVPFVLTIGYRF